MIKPKRIAAGAIFGLLYLAAEGGSAIVLTKLFTALSGRSTAGTYTLIAYVLALSNMLVTSLGTVISRSIALRLDSVPDLSVERWAVPRVVRVSLSILAASYLVAFIVAFWFRPGQALTHEDVAAWCIFCAGHLIRLYALHYAYVALGHGDIGADRRQQFFVAAIFFACSVAVLESGGSLLSVAILYAVVSTVALGAAAIRQHNKFPAPQWEGKLDRTTQRNVFKAMALGSIAILFNNIAGFFIMNGDVFVVQFLFGHQLVAEYSLYSRLAALLVAVGSLVPLMYFPAIAAAWGKGDLEQCRHYRRNGLQLGLAVAAAGGIASLIAYPPVVDWVFPGSRTLPFQILPLILVYAALSIHTVANGMPVIATGRHNFVQLSAVNAIANLMAAGILGKLFGPIGIPVGFIAASLIPSFLYRRISLKTFCAGAA